MEAGVRERNRYQGKARGKLRYSMDSSLQREGEKKRILGENGKAEKVSMWGHLGRKWNMGGSLTPWQIGIFLCPADNIKFY